MSDLNHIKTILEKTKVLINDVSYQNMHKKYDDLSYLASQTNVTLKEIQKIDEALSIDAVADIVLGFLATNTGENFETRKWQNKVTSKSSKADIERKVMNGFLTPELESALLANTNALEETKELYRGSNDDEYHKELELVIFLLSVLDRIRNQTITIFELQKILNSPKLAAKLRVFARANGIEIGPEKDALEALRSINQRMNQSLVMPHQEDARYKKQFTIIIGLIDSLGLGALSERQASRETDLGRDEFGGRGL